MVISEFQIQNLLVLVVFPTDIVAMFITHSSQAV